MWRAPSWLLRLSGSVIRRARVADAPAVHATLLAVSDEIPLAANFADEAHQRWVRDECRHQRVWVDDRSGAVAGAMVMSVNEIRYLAVPPAFRRQGVGRALAEHALAYIRGRRWAGVTARVRPANTPIVKLLESLGFAPHPILVAARPAWLVYAWGDVQ